ncbi:TonB-dependent receptor [Sphingomonas sp. ASV193]|uniref:TonB-dependent receptor n=1 Tax=Sphingomonas sp. ASV193 TaxID=3144405 RepID=UPI0032E8A64D
MLWGKANDRGHVMVALDYFRQNELNRGQRKYLNCPEAYVFRQGSNARADLIDPRTGKYHCEDLPVGQVWTYDYEYNYLGGRGNLRLGDGTFVGPVNLIQYQYPGETLNLPPIAGCGDYSCFQAPSGWFPTGYSPASHAVQNDFNPFAGRQTIIPRTERYTLYADAAYHLTDDIEAYGEFLGNRRKTAQHGYRQFWTFGFTSSGSYYGGNGSYWAPGWTGLNFLSPTAVTDHGVDASQRVDYTRTLGGFRGDLGGFMRGWKFDAHVQYSHNKGIYRQEQILKDAIDASSFQTASCVGQTLPVSGKQCQDLPWVDPNFLMGKLTPAQIAYLFDTETGKTIYNQLSAEASINGNLFDLPAGPVAMAIGVDARRDSIVDTPGAITLAGNAWGASSGGITAGKEVTTEAFGEIGIPIFRDRPFFKNLSINADARWTNVKATRRSDGFSETTKGNWTYKLGANWAVNNTLQFRGTYGTSFRAPALFEEFKADETGFIGARAIDPCVNYAFNLSQGNIDQRIADNCAAAGIPGNYGGGSITATTHSSGGIGNLRPETSKAWTASVILTPRIAALPRTSVSLAVDYFNIKVKGEISQLGAANIVFGCYDSPNFPTDPLCSLFTRGGPEITDQRAITNIYDKYINISSQTNTGVDFTLRVAQNLGRWGSLTLLGNATRQLKDKKQVLPTSPVDDFNGTIGDPKFVANLNATWKPRGGWSVFWGAEIYGSASNEQRFKDRHGGSLCQSSIIWGDYCVRLKVPTTVYHNASITKDFGPANAQTELTFGVRNIFDTKPPRVSTIGGGGLPTLIGPVVGTSQYDFLGRQFFLNVSKKF